MSWKRTIPTTAAAWRSSTRRPARASIEIQRATNEQLFRQNLPALSSWSGQSALYYGMERLGLSVNGVDNATSPATAIGKLQEALQLYSAAPSNRNLAETTLDAARQVVRTLNDGTSAIQSFRSVADQEIATAVDELNNLLADLRRRTTPSSPARAPAATSPTRSTSATPR